MSAILPLRPYQRQALDALYDAWRESGNRQAMVLATGLGKTVIFSHLTAEHLAANPADRVLVLVHTDELVKQAAAKVRQVAPRLSVGIVKAARNETTADVIVASVQTLRSAKRRAQIRNVGLVIVDECHHATAPTYRAILEHFGCFGPAPTLCVGFTATLMRGDGGPLGEIWPNVAFARSIGYGVRQRYLVPPRGLAVRVADLSLASVRTTKSDFREGDLGVALADSLAPETVARAYREHAADRSGIMFCPTVASAQVMADAMNEAGVTCEVIHGGLDMDTRRAILGRLDSGVTQVVANCMVLTEGFDSPRVSCVVVARPTKSTGLYIQMVGRGLRVDPLRPYEDQDCLVLDVVDTSREHDLCSIADLSDRPLDVRKARSGKTLIDLEDEFDRGEGVEPDEPIHYAGPVEAKGFDPLTSKNASARWGRTEGGTYFATAGQSAWAFLVPDGPGTYTVTWCTRSGTPYACPNRTHTSDCAALHGRVGGVTEHRGLSLEMAFGWADDLAADMGEIMTGQRPMLRAERAAYLGRARALGIDVPAGTRTEKLSALVDKVSASQVVDQWVPRVQRALAQDTEGNEG